MFYEELYAELGKLFYHIAGIDGKISPEEKEALQTCISKTWKPMEESIDRHGTDQAYLINFSFEFVEAEPVSENYLKSFENFYRENISAFTPEIISNILKTSKAIAEAYRGKNKKEQKLLDNIIQLFEH
ncbi:MAG: hypothetical protein WKF91_12905 [Segetibacter sp.]